MYVLLDTDQHSARRDQQNDQYGEPNVLTSELRDRLRYVEGQLEQERQAHAEARRLLAAALERIPPQLEAPHRPPEGPETTTESGGEAEPRSNTEGSQEPAGTPRRSWWREFFGFGK